MTGLGRKQGISAQEPWRAAWASARQTCPDELLDPLLDQTVEKLKEYAKGKRLAYGWSGGKDSLALRVVMEAAGIEDCVLGKTSLEYPVMEKWFAENSPAGLTTINTGQDLAWLAAHPELLFPQGKDGPRWFAACNHKAQDTYFKAQKLDAIVLGRRRADQNFCGPKGVNAYSNAKGITRYSPIAEWSHEAVFSLIQREGISMPPCYEFPRGYQVGTGAWPARQWTDSYDHGFTEVWQVDPDVVREAATLIPAARDWLQLSGND